MFGAQAQRGNDVVVIEWEDDPKRHLAVVGRIGGVDGARAAIEADLAAHRQPERRLQLAAPRPGDGRAVDPPTGLDERHRADRL